MLSSALCGQLGLIRPALSLSSSHGCCHPNPRAQDGYTPLIKAAKNGHSKIVTLLLKKGANPNEQNTVTVIMRSLMSVCVHVSGSCGTFVMSALPQ